MGVPITRRHALLYDFVEGDVAELRAPYRAAHIRLVRDWMTDGRLLMAGALGDPPRSALLVFAAKGAAEEFAQIDPYVVNGIVAAWRVEPWNVVS